MMKKLALTTALALTMGISAAAQAHPNHAGYATSSTDTVWKTGSGECWQHSYWTEDKKTVECGAEAAAAPAPAPEPKMAIKMVDAEESHIIHFASDSSDVTDVSAIVSYVSSLAKLNSIELKGYTDSVGSSAYNDALSQRRVDAVDAALSAAGIDTDGKVVASSYGEANPVKDCTNAGASRQSCLAENRRVEVSINGQKQIKVQQ